ncbi:CLUMA_CG018850, isoform A [Clunio marinus]|uniref:CLUMA_CG018850, isoform A n=1 Tax=Clunio marinus TaxID=568069 RepID=A0A1J1J096_9DIPT|nr:CLUMA_CG018850, isoform A [Clunio marinus]
MEFWMKYFATCTILLLITLECSCQRYYRQEQLDGNLCGNKRTLLTFLTQTMNKYEIHFNNEVNSVVLEKRFNATAVKRLQSDCTFKIDTRLFSKDSGIYVNILKMRLRQVKLTGVCIDSITIKYNDDVKKRYCGELPPGEIKSIEDIKGKVKITVSIDRGRPLNDDEVIEFQIAATAYKDCENFNREFNCKPNMKRSCISSNFVNDSIINCLEPSCSDERYGCQTSSILSSVTEEPTVINNLPHIFLSAITSLLLTMLCCGGCFFIVLKLKNWANPPPTSQTSTRIHRRGIRRRNGDGDAQTSSSPNSTPTAPPNFDKDDLPPSYDALFPEGPKQEAVNT